MPFEIERDGKKVTVYTQDELDAEVKGLKVTNDNLKAEKKEMQDKMAELKETSRQLEEAKAKAEGDTETQRRLAEEREAEKRQLVEEERKKFSDLLSMTKREKIENYLNDLVAELKPADSTRAAHLKKLLKASYEFDVDLESQQFKVTGDKVASAEDLKRLVTSSDEYSYLLASSGATGGGATGGKPSGAGMKKFNEYTGAELSQLRQANPIEYERLRREFHGR